MSLASLSITELRKQLTAGEITPTQIIDDIETAILAKDTEVKAYLSYDFDKAREQAANADLSLPLGGIPIGIKDNINTLGEPCTCATRKNEHGWIRYGFINRKFFYPTHQ